MTQRRGTKEHAVLDYLKEVVSELPTDARKQEVLANLDLINRHIQDIKERILLLPNDSRKGEIINAIDLISNFLASANKTMKLLFLTPLCNSMKFFVDFESSSFNTAASFT